MSTLFPRPSHPADLQPQTRVEVDPDGLNVALVVGHSQFVFSAGSDHVEAHLSLLRRWAMNCGFAAAALRHCHARVEAQRLAAAPVMVASTVQRPCSLCERANRTDRQSCHWCGNPLRPRLV